LLAFVFAFFLLSVRSIFAYCLYASCLLPIIPLMTTIAITKSNFRSQLITQHGSTPHTLPSQCCFALHTDMRRVFDANLDKFKLYAARNIFNRGESSVAAKKEAVRCLFFAPFSFSFSFSFFSSSLSPFFLLFLSFCSYSSSCLLILHHSRGFLCEDGFL